MKFSYALGILMGCLVIAACDQSQQSETTANASDDPRMAGFKGTIAKKYEDSREDWPERPQAPAGAPNVLVILLDDTGFGQLGAYGGLIETPNMDKLAAGGLTYTNFHTTALCSPSRAAIMAGRNHHSIGLGSHALSAMGFPGYNGVVPPQAASGAKVLQQSGVTTYALGKWDHTPLWEVSSSGPFYGWPSSEGFDHYYGFMSADIHNFAPIMYEDHWPTNPSIGKPDYHVSTDMADRAIYWMTAQKSISPDRPFMMFWAPGTAHAPHHAPTSITTRASSTWAGTRRAMRSSRTRSRRASSRPAPSSPLAQPTSRPGTPSRPRRRGCTRAKWRPSPRR
jgi:arylsulfatase